MIARYLLARAIRRNAGLIAGLIAALILCAVVLAVAP